MLKNIVVLCITIASAKADFSYNDPWRGRFFPHNPSEKDSNPAVVSENSKAMSHHGAPMGVADKNCDNAKTNLERDWNNDTRNYTCFDDKKLYLPNATVHPNLTIVHIPYGYVARHKCMNHSITYDDIIPTFGNHRPLWAKYGEYHFCPKQRWLHNMEHGAIVLLYHPCADQNEVDKIRRIIQCCIYRHIITPYNLLSAKRVSASAEILRPEKSISGILLIDKMKPLFGYIKPIALVTWGVRLEISKVDSELVFDFIKKHSLHGPEHTSKNGQYDHMLKEDSQIPPYSNKYDQYLCHKCETVCE